MQGAPAYPGERRQRKRGGLAQLTVCLSFSIYHSVASMMSPVDSAPLLRPWCFDELKVAPRLSSESLPRMPAHLRRMPAPMRTSMLRVDAA